MIIQDPVTLLCLFPCLTPFILSLQFTSLTPVSCSTSHHPTTLVWILLTTTTLDSPQDLFTLFYSANSNLSLHICFFCNSSKLPRICTPHLSVWTINILVHSSLFPHLSLLLGSPVSLRLNTTDTFIKSPHRLLTEVLSVSDNNKATYRTSTVCPFI
jgi:hypothetical protein